MFTGRKLTAERRSHEVQLHPVTRSPDDAILQNSMITSACIKLCQLHVRRRGDLNVPCRSHHDGHFVPGSLYERCLVRADETILCRIVKDALQQVIAETLGSLGHHDSLARNSRGDDRAIGCALNLFDGVNRREPGYCRAMFARGFDDVLDYLCVDEWPDRVMYQHDVSGGTFDRCQSVCQGLLPIIPAD